MTDIDKHLATELKLGYHPLRRFFEKNYKIENNNRYVKFNLNELLILLNNSSKSLKLFYTKYLIIN